MKHETRNSKLLPGFGLTMGYTVLYVSLIVIIPLGALFWKSAAIPWHSLAHILSNHFLIASLKVTFGLSLLAACFNAVFGFIAAWTLVRYPLPGRRLLDGLIDLPFALPTAVSGITLATLYAHNGWLGGLWSWLAVHVNPAWHWTAAQVNAGLLVLHVSPLLNWLGLPAGMATDLPDQIAYTRLGMLVALIFIGSPFLIRTLQPALAELDAEVEEAAASLGATRFQAFRRVLLPALLPATLTGFSLAFARGIGEYGSVIFISSNIPGKTQITAQLIMHRLENGDFAGATALGIIMLLVSFFMLGTINGLQWWAARRLKGAHA